MASLELILEASNATHRSLLCHIGHLYNNTSVYLSLPLSLSLSPSLSLSLSLPPSPPSTSTICIGQKRNRQRTLRPLASHIATNLEIHQNTA